MRHVWADLFPHNLKQKALFNIIKWMLIDTPPIEYFDIFFAIYLGIIVWWLAAASRVSYVNVFKPSLMIYTYLKIFFLELLPKELTRVVEWKLTIKSWSLRCREFLALVLYWVLNKASFESFEQLNHDNDWNFYLMRLYSEYVGHPWIWLCLKRRYQSLLEMPFAL